MRKTALVCSLFIVSILLNGCIIVSSNKSKAAQQECAKPARVESPQIRATLAEINAAAKLTSQSARTNIYKAIAKRPGLSPQERIHLTNAITMHLTSQSDREEVLLILVNNYPPVPRRMPRAIPTARPQKDTTSKEPVAEK